jgi:tRNA (guanine37-N1)-methyltransferase
MRARALVVPRAEGERVRRELREIGALRSDLDIRADGEVVALPIRSEVEIPAHLGTPSEVEFEARTADGPHEYSELLDWSDELKSQLPRSFDVIGDVVLIRVPDELAERSSEIGEALLRFVPGARIVGADHGVRGTERIRSLERIAGEGPWRTRHRENGLEMDVDPERAYFSPRLAHEHARVAASIDAGDRVYDLCCGVGPFSLAIARDGRAGSVTAVDANPEAIALLRASLARVVWGSRVAPVLARIEEFLTAAPPANRVIFNLPREGIKYLPSVARLVAPHGHLVYYEVTSRDEVDRRANDLVSVLDAGRWRPGDRRIVHPYSPSSDLVAYSFERVV